MCKPFNLALIRVENPADSWLIKGFIKDLSPH